MSTRRGAFFMFRLLILILAILTGAASLCCQRYTTGLQESHKRVDETAIIATLHTIARAQTTYSVSNEGNYGSFEQLTAGGYLDSRFNSTMPALYSYELRMSTTQKSSDSPGASYTCNADPAVTEYNKGRHFYLDSSSELIHVNAARAATAADE